MSSPNSCVSASHEKTRRHASYDNADFSMHRYSLPAVNDVTQLVMEHYYADRVEHNSEQGEIIPAFITNFGTCCWIRY